jgi:outer membrane cobalamin receptor
MKKLHITRTEWIVVLSLLFSLHRAQAQFNPTDSTKTDTSHVLRSDSLILPIFPIPLVGSIDRALSSHWVVADSTINFSDYEYPGDFLTLEPGVFIRDLASAGQLHGLTIGGLDGRAIAFMSDGVELNDPFTGVYNSYLYPTENIDRVEFIPATRSFLYGLNGTGGAINFVSKSKKAIHPYSRIRYSESVYGYGFFDGMFSQNLTRALNLTAGMQHGTLAGEYPNSDYDAWDARVKVRYNLNSRLNFYASEIFNHTQLGLNGGVDTASANMTGYNPIQAQLRNTDSYEKITRHDVQLGAAGELFPDSTFVTTLTFYHSTNLREYRDEENRPYSNGIFVQQDHWSQWYGARLIQHLEFDRQRVDIGAEVQSRGVIASSVMDQDLETSRSLFGKEEFKAADAAGGAVYARFDNYLNRSLLSYGGDLSVTPAPWIAFFGGYSRSYRFPTFEELYWRDSVVNGAQSPFSPEQHHLLQAGVRLLDNGATLVELTFFHRVVNDPIVTVPTRIVYPFPTFQFVQENQETFRGVEGTAGFRFGVFYAEGSAQFLETTGDTGAPLLLPRWSGTGGIYFWDKLVKGHLDLKVGLRGRVLTSYTGMQYNPQAWMYVPSTQQPVDASGVSDLVIMAHIGSAYVHFIWQNLLDLQYVVTPFFPQPERSVRFGISWEFTD